MYDENPGEIDFGSSKREVRVSEGSTYRESTVLDHSRYARLLILRVRDFKHFFRGKYNPDTSNHFIICSSLRDNGNNPCMFERSFGRLIIRALFHIPFLPK